MAQERTARSPTARPPRRRRTGRIILISLGVLVLVGVVLIALAPMLASGVVPGIAQSNINDQIQGRATVARASLSWAGPQRIGPINVVDLDGRPVADIEITSSRGLFSILGIVTGATRMDLGTTTISGTATVVRRPDGMIHLMDVFQPSPPDQPPHDIYLPKMLTGIFVLDGLDVTFIDERQLAQGGGASVIRIPALSGSASITNAMRGEARLAGHFLYGPTVDDATRQGGSIGMSAAADDLTEPDGRLVLERARFDAAVDIVEMSVAIADALAGMDGDLVAAIGNELAAQVRIDGTVANGRLALSAGAPGLQADVRLETTDGTLRTPQPGRIALRDGALLPLIPGFADAISAQDDVTFEQLPGGSVTIDEVNIRLPVEGRPLDLRGGTFSVALEMGEMIGQVRMPRAEGMAAGDPEAPAPPGEQREYRLAPFQAQLASRDLADRITLRASTQAMLGGESAGRVEVDLAAIDPLDAAGRPRPMFARDLDGVASLTGFATIILQPFVEGAGINMAEDVGPELDFVLRASATADVAPSDEQPGGPALPPTQLSLDVRSANIIGAAGFLFDQSVLMSDERGVQLEIGTLAPLLTRLFAEQGLTVESGAGAMLTGRDIRIDMAKLYEAQKPAAAHAAPDAPGGADLRAVAGVLQLEMTPAAGRLMLPEQPVRRWQLAQLRASIDGADLHGGVHVQAATSARLDGQEAGSLDVDVRITELLDAEGRPMPGLPAIDGRASLSQVAMAIVQPLVEDMGLDVQRGIGPRLDVVFAASSEAAAPGADGAPALPRTMLDVDLRAENITGNLPLVLDGGMLRTRGEGARIDVRSPGLLLGPGARDAGVELSEGGFLRVAARELALAVDGADELLERSSGEVEIAFGGFALLPMPGPQAPGMPPPGPLALQEVLLTLRLAPEAAPILTLRSAAEHQGTPFSAQGSLQLVGLDGTEFSLVRPIGDFEIRNLPTSLAMFMPAGEAKEGPDPFVAAQLVQDLVGPSVNIDIRSAAMPDGGAMDRRFTLGARSQQFSARAAADLDQEALHVRQFESNVAVSPQLAGTMLEMALGEQLAARPQVVQPAQFVMALQPLSILLADGLPQFAGAGEATLTARLERPLLVSNIVLAETDTQPPRSIGVLGLEAIDLQASFPLASLAPDSPPGPSRFALDAVVLGAADQRLMTLRSSGGAMIAGGRPVGPMTSELQLSIVGGDRLDEILGQDGMLVQALDQPMNIQARATVEFPSGAGALPADPDAGLFAFDRATVEAALTAPRLAMPQPLRLTILPDRMALAAPTALDWQMHHEWANRFLLGIMPGQPPAPQEARFTQPTALRLNIAELALARGEEVGPLLPELFATQINISSPGTTMLIGGIASSIAGLSAQIMGGPGGGALGFNIRMQDVGGGPGPGGEPAVGFTGAIYNLADARGHPTPAAAAVSLQGAARNIPTAIVDGFAAQGGLLVDALGPMVSLDLQAQGVTADGGSVRALATSDRARAEISGRIQGATFIADQPANISLSVITPAMGQRITQGLPLVGHLEKTTAEEPAVVNITNLVAPLDGDLRRLNAQISFDPGEARFAVSQPYAPLLRLIEEPGEAVIGRRLQPITLRITDGTMSYDRFNIPIGQFIFAMQGNVDLAARRLDVITFIPAGALSAEVSRDLHGQLGRLLGIAAPDLEEALMIPFRARGEFGRFSVEPDVQMLGRELERELLRPGRIIEGPAGDILDRLRPRRRENNEQPPK